MTDRFKGTIPDAAAGQKPTSRGDYPVGYRKPPRHTQFKPGQSGHPPGRPKHAKNFATALDQELRATVRVTEEGRRRKLSKQELLAKRLVEKGVELDPKYAPLLVALIQSFQRQTGHDVKGVIEPAVQERLTESIVQRVRATAENAATPITADMAVDEMRGDNEGGGGTNDADPH